MHVHLAGTETRPDTVPKGCQILRGMPAAEYHAIRALSQSSMKDLAVSPLRFWHRHINPNREAEPEKDCYLLGEALHCMVLEPGELQKRYAKPLDPADFKGCLFTVADLKQWLTDKGQKVKSGVLKNDLIAHVASIDPDWPIWEVLESNHGRANVGKTILPIEEWHRSENMAHVLLQEPKIRELLKEGEAEVSIIGTDATHGVPLKCRLDWTNSDWILDLKSFTTQRGNSVEKSISDAIFYQAYYRQYRLYSQLDQQARKASKPKRFLMAFIESEEPHDVRLKEFRAGGINGANVYHSRADLEIRDFCWLYKSCWNKYGVKPWIDPQVIDVIEDEQIRQLAFA